MELLEKIKHRKKINNKMVDKLNFNIPYLITENLKNELRDYQSEAIENYILMNNPDNEEILYDYEDPVIDFDSRNNHHLFHMATGAGKTMLMAASLLYLVSLGYKRFIFTTASTTLIGKTRFNLLPNLNSEKCEFKNKMIEINGQKLSIKEVSKFSKYSKEIEIMFVSINKLHSDIVDIKENSINLRELSSMKIAILADEAHHFQVASKAEQKKENNWENTISNILGINKDNKLLDFTATMDMKNDSIKDKYSDKLISDYTLKSFRVDGYSKEITLIQEENKEKRILKAIVINQLRYIIGLDNKINISPKILFKGIGTIDKLNQEMIEVLELISGFTINKLNDLIEENLDSEYFKILDQILTKDKEKEDFVSLLKRQFNKSSCLIVHSKDKDKDKKLKIANNIDNLNSIRMIFNIDMLNEGWDVKSLFDIVKLDSVIKKNKATTNSEVQLIGRGARIFSYKYKDHTREYDQFKRKFDSDIENPLRFLEEMNFYSANENGYINDIRKALEKNGLKGSGTKNLTNIKRRNSLRPFAKKLIEKYIFQNGLEFKYDSDSKFSDYNINIQVIKNFKRTEEKIDIEYFADNEDFYLKNIEEFLEENTFILNKSLNLISYFNGNNIISKFGFKSRNEMINDIRKLGDKISIKIIGKTFSNLNYFEKIHIMKDILIQLSKQLERSRLIKKGTKSFNNKYVISEVFKDYSKKEELTASFNEKISFDSKSIILHNENLFYYDHITWDSNLELEAYELFDKYLDSENYLVIRNDVSFKIYNPFSTDKGEDFYSIDPTIYQLNGEGFEPDFIILKKGNLDNEIYQYFIEVKGKGGMTRMESESNKWKELLLTSLENTLNINDSNDYYNIIGLPFFTYNESRNESTKKSFINLLS